MLKKKSELQGDFISQIKSLSEEYSSSNEVNQLETLWISNEMRST